uniref:C-type lectin domain-containing protein n=1 Tax=Anopheles dirus TaxID=7168 RepID=A0A182NPC8_9DIPT
MHAGLIALATVAIVVASLPTAHALRYTVHHNKVTFYRAWTRCLILGGYLATPELPSQNAAIWEAIKKTDRTTELYWLAGTDNGLERSWIWVTSNRPVGSIRGYDNWAAGEPNNGQPGENCLVMGFDGTGKCTDHYQYQYMIIIKVNQVEEMLPTALIAASTRAFSAADSMEAKCPPYWRHVCQAAKKFDDTWLMTAGLVVLAIVAIAASTLPSTLALRYTVHTTKVSFYEAWTQCIGRGGYLAAPETAQQNEAIWNAIKKTGGTSKSYWLAGTDNGSEGTWIWISRNKPVGSVGGYINWASGAPNVGKTNQNCLMLQDEGTAKWVDAACDDTAYYHLVAVPKMASKILVLTLCLALFAIEAHGFKRYVGYRRNLNYFAAWQACRLMGGSLASIESADENGRVVDAIKAAGNFASHWLIGGTDIGIEGRFVWIGINKELTSSMYTNWATGEPSDTNGSKDCIMNTELILLAIVAVAASTLPATVAHRYSVHSTKVEFFEAWTQCIIKGGRLATPDTAQENEAISSAIKKAGSTGSHWLAGTDIGIENSWIWITTNVPVGIDNGYLNWASGEPNNSQGKENCVVMSSDGTAKWNDVGCDALNNYVCEYAAPSRDSH